MGQESSIRSQTNSAQLDALFDAARYAARKIREEDARLAEVEPAYSEQGRRNLIALGDAYFDGGDEAFLKKFDEIFPPDDPRYK